MAKFPPRYVNIPAEIVYCKNLSPKYRDTYIQLRGLAWQSGYQETAPVSFVQLAEFFGKSVATVYEHVRFLRVHSWLQFREAEGSAYIFSFPEEQGLSENSEYAVDISENSETPIHLLTNKVNPSTSKEKEKSDIPKNQNQHSDEPKAILGRSDPNLFHPAVVTYKSLTHITANAHQRAAIVNAVQDENLWRCTVEHWLEHGWRPLNVAGMLDSYRNGGRAGCIICNRATTGRQGAKGKISIAQVDEIFARVKNGNDR